MVHIVDTGEGLIMLDTGYIEDLKKMIEKEKRAKQVKYNEVYRNETKIQIYIRRKRIQLFGGK